MSGVVARPRILRFDSFELDPQSGELRKGEANVRLQEQPADLLLMLVERPGQVVTREELRERLWPDKTFGDFDTGLNKAVRRLREALDDSAQNPRYVETLPQHGYRFLAPVTEASLPHRRRSTPRYALLAAGGLAMLLPAAYFVMHLRRTVAPGQIRAVAVLPFANLSGDPGHEYFADGVTDSLITELGKVGALRVVSRQSTLRYKTGHKSLTEIAGELDVDAVVEGTVVRDGGRVRITAQLLRIKPEQHLWAESYERNYADVLAVQREIARTVADQVKAKLTPGEQARLGGAPRVNPGAYEAYLRGRYLFHGYSPDGFRKAIDSLRAAVTIDPNFAPAWAALSPAHGATAYWGHVRPGDAGPQSEAAARKANELDDNLAEGHCWLGANAAYLRRDWAVAERELQRALELNPSSADAHTTYGMVLTSLRRPAEAMKQFWIARGLDPFPPVRSAHIALAFMTSGQYQKAADQHRHGIEIAPDFFITRWAYWRVLHCMGMSDAALGECKRAYELLKDAEVVQALELGQRQSGYAGAMKAAALTLEKRARTKYVAGSDVARLHTFAGEHARAVEWLETARKDGDPRLHLLWAEPDWEPLYGNSRFRNLLRKMGFPSVEKAPAWAGTAR